MREGRNPTVNAVRERMGGGSPNVVAPALQRWRLAFAGRLSDNASSAAEVLPPGVQELVEALWSRALFEAHRVAAETHRADGAVEEMNAAIKALKAATARIERREALLEARLTPRTSRAPAKGPNKKSGKSGPGRFRPKPKATAPTKKKSRRGAKRNQKP